MSKKPSGAAQQHPEVQSNQRSDARTRPPAPQQWVTVAKAPKKHPRTNPGPRDGALGRKSQVPQTGSGSEIPSRAPGQAGTGDEAGEINQSSRKGSYIFGRSGDTSRGDAGVSISRLSGDIPAVPRAPAPIRRDKREITEVDEALKAELLDDAPDLLAQVGSIVE